MKIRLPLAIVAAVAAAGCATGPGMMGGGSTRSHGGGADVPVWVYESYLSVGEEPIQRRASTNAPVIFTLVHDRLGEGPPLQADAGAEAAVARQRTRRIAQRRNDAGHGPTAVGEQDLVSLPHLVEDGRELLPCLADTGGLHDAQCATSSTALSNRATTFHVHAARRRHADRLRSLLASAYRGAKGMCHTSVSSP